MWVWDPAAGTPEQRKRAEELRRQFAENRLSHKHSADELLRWVTRLAKLWLCSPLDACFLGSPGF